MMKEIVAVVSDHTNTAMSGFRVN